jgi:hypothetical protein
MSGVRTPMQRKARGARLGVVLLVLLAAAVATGCTSTADRPVASVPEITPTPSVTGSPGPGDGSRSYARDGFALWPEDTYKAALSVTQGGGGDPWRSDPKETADRFASEVLGWSGAAVHVVRSKETSAIVAVSRDPSGDRVDLSLRMALPDLWSVLNVLPHGEYFPSVHVHDGRASLDVELDGDATSAEVTVGYGGRDRSVEATRPGTVSIDLGFETDTSGHFLILLRNAGGETISAIGTTLPAGDFAAS